MQRKSYALKDLQWKADNPGAFRARLATLNVVDNDKDVTVPGAFPAGKSVVISAYMHSSWYDALPVGWGVIGANEKEAWVDGQFFVNTATGKDHYLTVKGLAEQGLGEWSYGYEVLTSSTDPEELKAWPGAMRILKGLNVFEGSPVLMGAGINTVTESIKSSPKTRALARRMKAATLDASTLAIIAQIDFEVDHVDELVDSLMDQLGIPDPDEDALTDADLVASDDEQPSNPAYGLNSRLSYQNHAKHAQASVQAFVSRSKSLADLRAKEGRTLSAANRDRLASLMSALTTASTDIQDLLDATADDGKAEELDAILFKELRKKVLAA